MHRWLKGKLVVGLAALAVIAFAGGAFAATENSGPPTRQAFLNDVAKRLRVTPQQLSSALNGASLDQLQAAVKAGQLTQAQANAIEQRLKQAGGAAAVPFGFFGYGGPGPAGAPFPRLRLFPGPFAGGGEIGSAASYLGLSFPQLFQQLSGGKSLAQIATARGKTVNGLEQAMTAAVKTRLDKLLAAKAITAAQEKRVLSDFSARLAQEVNQKGMPLPLPLRRGNLRPWGGPGGPGWGGPPAAIAPATPYAPLTPAA